MADPCTLIIAVISASGIEDIEGWGMRVCTTADKLATTYPERYRPFAKNAFSKLREHEGVVVCHSVVPLALSELFTDTLFDACGEEGSMGTCVATIEADSDADYMADIDQLRAAKKTADGLAPVDSPLPEPSWITTVVNDYNDAAKAQMARSYSLFIDFLDAQFEFADDIERFLASQRQPSN